MLANKMNFYNFHRLQTTDRLDETPFNLKFNLFRQFSFSIRRFRLSIFFIEFRQATSLNHPYGIS